MPAKEMNPNLGLDAKEREGAAALLVPLLADAHVLYVKTRNFHWNVTGPHFAELHKLFEAQYDALAEEIDGIAERIRALGARAPGTMKEFLGHARLKEQPGKQPEAMAMVGQLLEDHEALARRLREEVDLAQETFHDAGTADFLTGLLEAHEKTAWMLRATLGA